MPDERAQSAGLGNIMIRSKANQLTFMISFLCVMGCFLSGCRIFAGEVACRADRDCPWDVLSFCTSYDGGLGVCTNDEEYRGEYEESESTDGGDLDAGQQSANGEGGAPFDASDAE